MVKLDISNNLEAWKLRRSCTSPFCTKFYTILFSSFVWLYCTWFCIKWCSIYWVTYDLVICQHIQSLSSNAALLHLSAQKFIPLYSPHLHDSITHNFVQNGTVFIELYTIYSTSTSNPSKLSIFEKTFTPLQISDNLQPVSVKTCTPLCRCV